MQNNESKSSNFSAVKILTYPLIGLVFVVSIISSVCYNLVKYTLKGIQTILLLITLPFKKSNKVKNNKIKKQNTTKNNTKVIKNNVKQIDKKQNTNTKSKKKKIEIIEDYELDSNILTFRTS